MRKTNQRVQSLGNQLFFTGPTMLAFTVTIIIPFIFGIYLTFLSMTTVTSPIKFSGLKNYVTAFTDGPFWTSMWLTAEYVLASIVLVNVIGFALAYLVTSGLRAQNFFRTSFFTPNLIGGLVLGYIWQFVFVKVLPMFGEHFHIQFFKLGWLGDPTMAFWSMVIVGVWQQAGYMMIIFIAGLVSIPKSLIEASTIDGASGFQRLIKIILPMMAPSFVITIFLTLKNAFMVYDLNLSLTEGGPFDSTKLVSMYVVDKAFTQMNYSVGQAEAIILFVCVAVVTGIQVYMGKKMEVEA